MAPENRIWLAPWRTKAPCEYVTALGSLVVPDVKIVHFRSAGVTSLSTASRNSSLMP